MQRLQILKKIYVFFKKERRLYGKLAIFKILLVLLSFIPPLLYISLVNVVFIDGKLYLLPKLIGEYLAVFAVETIVIAVQKKTYYRFFSNLNINLKRRLLENITHLTTRNLSNYTDGDLNRRIEKDVDSIEKFLSTHILEYGYNLITVIVITCILFWMSSFLAICGLAMIPISFIFAKFMGKKVKVTSEAQRGLQGECEGYLFQTFNNWKEIKCNNLQELEEQEYQSYACKLSSVFKKNQLYWWLNRTFISFKDFFITRMNLYFIGGVLIILGHLEIGVLLGFMNYYEQFYQAVSSLIQMYVDLKSDSPNIKRILEIFEKKPERKKDVRKLSSNIELNHVFFRYNVQQSWILENVSFQVLPHEMVAVVGSSGCGKSSLLKLMCGLYAPEQGVVRLGGYDLQMISRESVTRKIGIVLQDPFFLNLSIRENLSFAKTFASPKEMYEACKKANIAEFIQSLPDGLDTVIGERGVKLSGGQRQRLAIAQVLLKDPDIIFFDEATSSLDGENENIIVSALKNLTKEKTIIIVAHRYSSIRNSNRILLLDNGAIIAEGSYNQLWRTNNYFRQLFQNQYNNKGGL